MDNETMEHYITKIDKYDARINGKNLYIMLSSITLGVVAIYIALQITADEIKFEAPNIYFHIAFTIAFISAITQVISSIVVKAGMKARIEEIKEFFEHHGLSLEDELSKGRSR